MINQVVKHILGENLTNRYREFRDTIRHELRKYRLRRLFVPVIIFQPGKVGSRTMHRSLQEAFKRIELSTQVEIKTPVYHAHVLNHLDLIVAEASSQWNSPARLNYVLKSKALREEIDSQPRKDWNIISLVRDPVALRVSALFQMLKENIPDWKEGYEASKLTVNELQEMLLSYKFRPEGLDTWFDRQVRDFLGIDVYLQPFDHSKGYQIYDNRRGFRLLVIRLEDLDRVHRQAMRDFLGIPDFELINTNVGDQKEYRELYREFKSVALPASYLDRAYNTRFAQRFYSAEEIQAFREHWLNPENGKAPES
jgi:hypothetical protein